MKILYATDLHGFEEKYDLLYSAISDHDILIVGSDILPYGSIDGQEMFIEEFLPEFFEKVHIPIIIDFGNDDNKCLFDMFRQLVDRYEHVNYSHMNEIIINKFRFIGMHFVPDYPFQKKDWCRSDLKFDPKRSMCSEQRGPSFISSLEPYYRFKKINLNNYLKNHLSIQEELEKINADHNTVCLFHSPPKLCGLDVTSTGRVVGSTAVTSFIIRNQPMLTLHGHIHESFKITKKTIGKIDRTVCINPGQYGKNKGLICCEFDLKNIEGSYNHMYIEK